MLAAPPLPERRTFPVPLVCPDCARPLDEDHRCGGGDGPRLQWWHGLPRTLFGQSYWGETSRETMRRLLDLLPATPWREALRQAARDEAVTKHLLQEIGADFVYGMPWDRIRTVLEIGSGMGFMTAPLAKFAETVVALEAVPERALFLARRAEQDGLDNIHPIIASGTALPFPPESFDLVAMNGVFEYIGLWGQGDPRELQQRFLERIHRLLKPGGFFYIGIETRFSLSAWLGARDHSGLRFTSLLPRRLADWYCRRRRVPFYGSAHALDGYRTYTHSPRQYARMMQDAGFGSVEVYGCFDGYNRQLGIAPLHDFHAWKTMRNLVDPPCSALGSLRRLVSANRWTYRALENEVVVFACKKPNAGRLFWSDLPTDGPVIQRSTGDKVNALRFEEGSPISWTKVAKDEDTAQRAAREYEFLSRMEKSLGHEAAGYAVRWPRPLGVEHSHGRAGFVWEFAAGQLLSNYVLPRSFRARRLTMLLRQLAEGYVELTARLTRALCPGETRSARELLETWSAMRLGSRVVEERVRAACRRLAARNWPLEVAHGDLTLNNVILSPGGQMILVDWENAALEGLPALDLFRLLYDAWLERGLLGPAKAERCLATVRRAVTEAWTKQGIAAEDFQDIEMLFVAHQHEFDRARQSDVAILIGAYSDPRFTLLHN